MKIHFIGIGGIGASALAQYYLSQGWRVSGSDLEDSEILRLLKEKGAKIFIGPHKAKNLPGDANKVIYSAAVPSDNPELKKAQSLISNIQYPLSNIQIQTYAQALGKLTKQYWTIAVAGTHGKSTTCAMLAEILIKAGLNPTVILGTKLKEFGNSNFRAGHGPKANVARTVLQGRNVLVIEADEWRAAFLNYWPKMIVLTNIEKEHLDFYRDLKHILKTFREFIGHLPENGVLVVEEELSSKFKACPARNRRFSFGAKSEKLKKFKVKSYSLRQKEAGKLRVVLKVPGEHNVSNALAALTAARALKIPDKISFKALSDYKGSWRRFEEKNLKLKSYNLKLISDYAHHPTEITATLKAARERFPKKKIWVVFQPHQYQRTFYFFDDFVRAFKEAPVDKIIITDVYDVAGREKQKIRKKVSAEKLVKALKKNHRARIKNQPAILYLPFNGGKIAHYLKNNLKGGEIIVVMGAGSIYKLVDNLACQGLDKKENKKDN